MKSNSRWAFYITSRAYYAETLGLDETEPNIIMIEKQALTDDGCDGGCCFEFKIEYHKGIGWQYHIFDECFKYLDDMNYFFKLFTRNNMKFNFDSMIIFLKSKGFTDVTQYIME